MNKSRLSLCQDDGMFLFYREVNEEKIKSLETKAVKKSGYNLWLFPIHKKIFLSMIKFPTQIFDKNLNELCKTYFLFSVWNTRKNFMTTD